MSDSTEPGPWRRTEEAARRVGYSPSSFEKFRVQGCGPRYSQRGPRAVVHYHDDEVDAWLRANSRTSTSQEFSEAA